MECNTAYLGDFSWVSHRIALPLRILPAILFFVAVQLLLHALYCLSVWVISILAANFLKLRENHVLFFAMGIWSLGILTLVVLNQLYFPYSKFAELTAYVLSSSFSIHVALGLFLSLSVMVVLFALTQLSKMMMRVKLKFNLYLPAFAFAALAGSLWMLFSPHQLIASERDADALPNIIIIGADSLRPDFLSFFGQKTATPYYDAFLKKAAVFSESVTPLARTFPSWMSILTGEYPLKTGARSNLESRSVLHIKNTLPDILKTKGYHTIYATDETRFSNLEKQDGFDQIVTPPMGLDDFLVGTFNDFPLSNLLINTRLGKWLFPYSYANRPVFFTYNPDTFLQMVEDALPRDSQQPLFLNVHFCLPHAPYVWATTPLDLDTPLKRYQASVVRVDQQMHDLMTLLKARHILDHAIVILLSDHGEALELPNDRITQADLFIPTKKSPTVPHFYPPSLDDERVDQSAGHGTDVLGLPQYHTLLAFRFYGLQQKVKSRVVPGWVSLLDIRPTLLSLLHIKASPGDGQSLLPVILGQKASPPAETIFLESDFSPQAIRTVYPDTQAALLEGVDLFQIDPVTTRLTVKPAMATMILNSKQRAILQGNWILALYPQKDKKDEPILVNLKTGAWTNDLSGTFARQSPAIRMLHALKSFYGNEIIN